MNPFDQRPVNIDDSVMDWGTIYPTPYNKNNVDPYTRIRIILMNGIEVESALFKHQFYRNCYDNDLRRDLALSRRVEQQQQKHVCWMKPLDETQLETTIGYEHVAVDLTAWLAQNEPDAYVKQALDFALLEDFDHLYRYSNLLDLDSQIPAQQIVKSYVDITPGRPTIAEHRHPWDSVKYSIDNKKADIRTKLNTLIITSGEQQTMNFYMNVGANYYNDLGRQLYQEIGMIEEDHVSHYGALLDPRATWLENLLLHEYMECYLYYSFYEDETCPNTKSVWELHYNQEVAHLHRAADLLYKYEKRDWRQVLGTGMFPALLKFHDTRDYVRKVLAEQVLLSANRENYKSVYDLGQDHEYFCYQKHVNNNVNQVASHVVVSRHQQQYNVDYRAESQPNPIKELADHSKDNTELARTAKPLVTV